MLLLCLIFFFIILIIYQLILANNIIEGLENNSFQPYDLNNPNNVLILAQQNAGNINYLNDRMNNIQNLNQQVQDLSNNFIALQDQVNEMILSQKEYTNNINGGEPIKITGSYDEKEKNNTYNVSDTKNLI
jgi:hypothetical protein